MGETIPELMNGDFDSFIKEGVVVIDFFAEWCMPCVMMGPVFEGLSESFAGKVSFGKVNVEDAPNIAAKFGVRSIPHFIVFNNGKKVEEFIGSLDEQEFEEKLKRYS